MAGQHQYDYPGRKMRSHVWKYFGFLKTREGPPVKENLDMSRVVCRECGKQYAFKGVYILFECATLFALEAEAHSGS